MINSLFELLSAALYSAPPAAVAGAFAWGIASVLLSPCHLASIPLIVGYVEEQGNISTKRAFYVSLVFSAGILVTVALIGVITGMLGRIAGDIGRGADYIVSGVLVLLGLHLMDIIPLPLIGKAGIPGIKKRGLSAAFLLGLIFGVALGPCTFAFMAPLLGIAFSVASSNTVFAFLLVLAYAVGHCAVIVFAGTFTEILEHYLSWNGRSRGAVILRKVCGVLVVAAGVRMFFYV